METTPVFSRYLRHGLAVAFAIVFASPLFAQYDPDLPKKPTTTAEFWRAVQFEIAVGKYDVAAQYLKGLLALNPTDKDLLAIEEKEGMAVFLELRTVAKWSDDPKAQLEAKQNAETLIDKVSKAVVKFRSDPERIQKYIGNLNASPEEREYAIAELKKSGAAIMPHLLAAAIRSDPNDRSNLLSVIPLMDADVVPALLAAFDIDNGALRMDFIEVLARRSDIIKLMGRTETDPRPTLWYMATQPDPVGQKARTMLQMLERFPKEKQPRPIDELIKAAEAIYQHKTTFSNAPEAPLLWQWDGKVLVPLKLTVSQAEEYLGLRYARWALFIDPRSESAQIAFLNIATEKAFERAGTEQPLIKSSPAVHDLLALARSTALYKMLDRAMAENHLLVALGVTQILGERAQISSGPAALPESATPRMENGIRALPEPLIKALNSKDRRVSLAAADALIRLPGPPSLPVRARVVEVFRAALANPATAEKAAGIRPKALVADADFIRADLLAQTLRQAGFDSVVTHTGRDTLRRLTQATDIDVVWIDHELPYPQLPHLITEIRSDYRFGRLPVYITLAQDVTKAKLPELDVHLERLLSKQPNMKVDEKTIVRIVISYDGFAIDQAQLADWLKMMHQDFPTVRISQEATLLVKLALEKIKEEPPDLRVRIKDITIDLPDVTVRQESPTRITFVMDGTKPPPAALDPRLQRLQEDFKSIGITRELPSRLIITSALSTAVSPDAEWHVKRIVQGFPNVQVGLRPLSPENVLEGMNKFVAVDPMAKPLSPTERKDQQLLAIEDLRRLAIGQVPGYDVRPAANEIRAALRSDDLALAAIEAVGQLPGKDAQQDLANLVLDTARPANLRIKAAEQLVRHIQVHTSAPLTDAQIQGLLRVNFDEKDAGVKSAVAVVVGAIPRERILKNLPDEATRQEWTRRLLNYKPNLAPPAAAPAPAAPAPAPPPKEEKKDEPKGDK
ncbi:MAG TPA: response regulator [Gemmataceae bacterium]|nr:response regulator [Gemmataceae bacterium]